LRSALQAQNCAYHSLADAVQKVSALSIFPSRLLPHSRPENSETKSTGSISQNFAKVAPIATFAEIAENAPHPYILNGKTRFPVAAGGDFLRFLQILRNRPSILGLSFFF
jgi:hypothetical protein